MSPSTARALVALVAAASIALLASPILAEAAPLPPKPDADAWLLVDAGDGERLVAKHAHDRRAIASATKLMTAYVALEALPLRRRITAPPYDPLPLESLMGLRAGERVSVRHLLYGLLLPSGNDAAKALAVGAAGSVPAFVEAMNAAARRLGLGETHYANPIGFDHPDNYSSASDLVALALALRREPLLRRIVDTPAATLRSGSRMLDVVNRNHLLQRYPWVNGVKTGHTVQARYVLVVSGRRRGVTLVGAVLGAPSEAARDAGALELLRYGFSLYRRRPAVENGARLASAELRYQDSSVELLAARAARVVTRREQEVVTEIRAPVEVEGPIERGQRLGVAVVKVDGSPVARVGLRAAAAAPDASLLDRADSALPGPRWVALSVPLVGAVAIVILIAGALGTRRARAQSDSRAER